MYHTQASRVHTRAEPGSIVSFSEASTEQRRDERVERHALRGGSRLEPLVQFLVHPGDELFHTWMIAETGWLLSFGCLGLAESGRDPDRLRSKDSRAVRAPILQDHTGSEQRKRGIRRHGA